MQRRQSHHALHESSHETAHNTPRVSSDQPRTVGTDLSRVRTIRSIALPKDKDRHQGRHRMLAYYGHALIVFNVYGIPLSFGPYMEYYYNSRFPTAPFYYLATIPACQIACIFSLSSLAPPLYQWNAFWSTSISGILVAICFAISPRFNEWWLLLIVRGIFMGSMLGILRGVALLCLASHYRNNFPLVSTQSGFAAMIGAACYTAMAWVGLRNGHYKELEMANFGLSFGIFVISAIFLRQSKLCPKLFATEQLKNVSHKPGDTIFHVGYLIVFFGFFVWPILAVVLISSPPSNQFPEFGAYVLFGTFGAGLASSMYSGSIFARRKLGSLNIFIGSSIVAGCCTLSLAWAPYYYIALIWGSLYGLMLGSILTLHIKVITLFHGSEMSYHPNMIRNFQIVSVVTGLGAGAGVFLAGMFVELVGGFKVTLTAWGGLMVAGGVLMAWGRWRRVGRFRVAI